MAMSASTLPTDQQDREVFLREHEAASFIDAVAQTQRDADTVLMTIKAFAGEPDVLYVALDYAYAAGVTITMVAPEDTGRDDLNGL